MADDEFQLICDYCGKAVDEDEHADCVPDNTGHCIRCGKQIDGENAS